MLLINQVKSKKIIVLLTEISVILLVCLGLLPRELVIFSTALLIFYFLFSPVKESLWLFVVSIPLFTALPLSESFDYMANWRPLLVVLFLILCFKLKMPLSWWKEKIKNNLLAYLLIILLIIALISLWSAEYVWPGLKKIIFFANIFLLFLIIQRLGEKEEIGQELISALKLSSLIVLGVGLAQLASVFWVSLYHFWQFWASRVIPLFYGQNLGSLLSQSNTWFSYYRYLPPTLRIFSVFPDSHSFALFIILSLPLWLTNIFLAPQQIKWPKRLSNYLLLIAAFLAIFFSGSRGTWLSAGGALLFFCLVWLAFSSPSLRSKIRFFDYCRRMLQKKWSSFISLALGSIIIFFLLSPLSSGILLLSQLNQEKNLNLEKASLFERSKSLLDLSEVSVKSRLQIWEASLKSVAEHPFLGIGLANFPLILNEDIAASRQGASAHNLYLEVAAEMGVFALAALIILFWLVFKKSWQVLAQPTEQTKPAYLKYWAGFWALAFVWTLGYSFFDVVLFNDKVLLFLTANLGLLYLTKHKDD